MHKRIELRKYFFQTYKSLRLISKNNASVHSNERYSVKVKIIMHEMQGNGNEKCIIMHSKFNTMSLIFSAVSAVKSGNKWQQFCEN